jgi:parallel beta-helix repeat protein
VRIENCIAENNAGFGLHPGSGSQRPIIRNNRLTGNDIGLFFCWGVKYGLAENNRIEGNRIGISIGHRDTDNLIIKNEIRGSREVGVLFRPERGKDFAGHRNRLVQNRLIDNGGAKGAAIDIQGATEAVVLLDNEIIETRPPAERIGVRLGRDTRAIQLKGNRFEGLAKDVVQMP